MKSRICAIRAIFAVGEKINFFIFDLIDLRFGHIGEVINNNVCGKAQASNSFLFEVMIFLISKKNC